MSALFSAVILTSTSQVANIPVAPTRDQIWTGTHVQGKQLCREALHCCDATEDVQSKKCSLQSRKQLQECIPEYDSGF